MMSENKKVDIAVNSNLLMLYINVINETLNGLPRRDMGSAESVNDVLEGLRRALRQIEEPLGQKYSYAKIASEERAALMHAIETAINEFDDNEFHSRIGVFRSYAMAAIRQLSGDEYTEPALILEPTLLATEIDLIAKAARMVAKDSSVEHVFQTGATKDELVALADTIENDKVRGGFSLDELMALLHTLRLYGEASANANGNQNELQGVMRKLITVISNPT